MKKFRMFYDKEKEEEWLNGMCQQGWGMTNYFGGVYTFEPCSFGEYIYQVDLPDLKGAKGSRDQKKREYIEFVESTGAEYVCSWVFYMIFRKKASEGDFKLYTDIESEIKLFERLRQLFLAVALIEVFFAVIQTANYINYTTKCWGFSLGVNAIMFISLFFIYALTIIIFIMIVKFTRKINKLRRK